MKKLLLVRHAKAEKEGESDIDRPLKYTGMQDAAFMAEKLKENLLTPQLIITSPALRTKTTAEIISDHFLMPEPQPDNRIYEATEKTWLNVIKTLPEEYDFVAIVGHNPGVSQVIYELTGEVKEVHTATTAVIEFNTDKWASISGGTGKLSYFSWPNA